MTEKHNPFFNMGPIEDPRYFVNREKEVRKLLQYVGSQMSCSIVGSRKIGKSSLVKQAMRLATDPDYTATHLRKCVWVYLNFDQMLSITKLGFWKELLKRLGAALNDLPEERREGIDVDWEHLFQSETIAASKIDARLRELASRGIKPIIVMDEFEGVVRNPNLDYSFYGELRALAPQLTYVTVTQRPLHSLECYRRSTSTSPFFNIFVILPVRLFSLESARELFERLSCLGGNPYSPDDIEFLIDLAGCHPFFLQQAGYQLFDICSKDKPHLEHEDAYQAVENEFQLQARPHFESFWPKLSQHQKSLLQRIAEVGGLGKSSLSPPEKIVLYELEDHALVSSVDKENYRVLSRAFDEFVRRSSFSTSC